MGVLRLKIMIFLSSRFVNSVVNAKYDFKDCLRIKARKDEIVIYDDHKLRSLGSPITVIRAYHNNKTSELASTEDAHGLQSTLRLAVGSRVMLNQNLWTAQGLCNGTLGTIIDIIYQPTDERNHLIEIPICVLIKFDGYTGPTISRDAVPVTPYSACFTKNGTSCVRKQFPIAYAISIHKGQGITLDKAVVDIGPTEFSLGLSYVAFSRVTSYQDLLIDPTFPITRLLRINKNLGWTLKRTEMEKLTSGLT